MNQTLNEKLIKKFKEEVCPIHGKTAKLETKGDIIVIGDYCCSEFYNMLLEKFQEERNKQIFRLF